MRQLILHSDYKKQYTDEAVEQRSLCRNQVQLLRTLMKNKIQPNENSPSGKITLPLFHVEGQNAPWQALLLIICSMFIVLVSLLISLQMAPLP